MIYNRFILLLCFFIVTNVYSGIAQGKGCCAVGDKDEGLKAKSCYQYLLNERSCKEKAGELVGGDIPNQHYKWFPDSKCTDLEFQGAKLCPLPLLLTIESFSASRHGDGVEIELITSSEKDTFSLGVYRAPAILRNLQQITRVCLINSEERDNSGSIYFCRDENAPEGVVYWPVEVDNDGKVNNYLEFMRPMR